MLLTRAEISTVYAGGVDAVIGLIEQMQAIAVAQQEQIAVLSARVKGKRQDSERKRAVAHVTLQWPQPDVAYAACSTAHTSPHRSWNRRRCSAKDTVSFICWR